MSTTGPCVLCNLEVTEEDYRREIDCPSKSCPGRVYHEDCIAAYLRRTKYSKDRCTGFPCPAILSTGKPCPGYVCKMHTYFPSNQKKKQARLQAAIAAAAAAPKPKAVPAKPRAAGAQAAIAAIQSAATGGNEPIPHKLRLPQSTVGVPTPPAVRGAIIPAAQQQSIIPGMDRDELQRRVAALKAEAKAANGGSNPKAAVKAGVGVKKQSVKILNDGASSDEERPPRNAMVWDAFMKPPGQGGELNYYDLEHRNGGGRFTARLQKRLAGKDSNPPAKLLDGIAFDCSSSETDSVGTWSTPAMNRAGSSGLPLSPDNEDDADFLAVIRATSNTPKFLKDLDSSNNALTEATDLLKGEGTALINTQVNSDVSGDRVYEYDVVYAVEDGSYLVFDSVSSDYVGLEDFYGSSPQLVECAAEDGNLYLCVAVRQPQLECRIRWQEAWVQAQFNGDMQTAQQPVPTPSSTANQQIEPTLTIPFTDFCLAMRHGAGGATQVVGDLPAWTVQQPTTTTVLHAPALYGAGLGAAGVHTLEPPAPAGVEDDDTDVASLLQLLCV